MRMAEVQQGLRSKEQFKAWCEDEILDLLLIAYTYGCEDANQMLYTEIAPTYKEMRDSIYKKIAGKDFAERIAEYAESGTVDEIMRVADTDSHRVYNEAVMNTAENADSEVRKSGEQIYKRWETMLDDRVREPHRWLEGVEIPLDADFIVEGDRAKAPGGFESPELNINCRCVLSLFRQ